MSLKAFHLVFMLICVLAATGFAVWAFNDYAEVGDKTELVLGIGAIVAGIGGIGYTIWFLKKLKNVSYL